MTRAPTKIYLIDDHPFVRDWLTMLLSGEPDLKVCGSTGDVDEGLRAIKANKPHVAIVDLSLRCASGYDLITRIVKQQPQTRVVVHSMHEEYSYAERAFVAGARGYVSKPESSLLIKQAVREVAAGGVFVNQVYLDQICEKIARGEGLGENRLSAGEQSVFDLLGLGMSTRKIAENLKVNIKTVESYCARIKKKRGLPDAAALRHAAIIATTKS